MNNILKIKIFKKYLKDIEGYDEHNIEKIKDNIRIDEDGSVYIYSDNRNSKEYLIFTDKEATKECKERILEDLWAFRPEFICNFIRNSGKLNDKDFDNLVECIRKIQDKLCESANPIIKALIPNIKEFIKEAIEADGRGHFLASYDSNENEVILNGKTYFVYRRN